MLTGVLDMRMWALAGLLFLAAFAGFVAGIKLANHEHRKDANRRPYVPPTPVAVATRIPEPNPAPATVVHVHLPAMPTALPHPMWPQPQVVQGSYTALLPDRVIPQISQ
jgi:hypothetical protein